MTGRGRLVLRFFRWQEKEKKKQTNKQTKDVKHTFHLSRLRINLVRNSSFSLEFWGGLPRISTGFCHIICSYALLFVARTALAMDRNSQHAAPCC